jgi:predicted dehydrogenase
VTLELDGRSHRVRAGGDDPYGSAFRGQLADFLEASAAGGEPEVAGDDGVAVLEVIEAAYARRTPLPQPWVTEAPG